MKNNASIISLYAIGLTLVAGLLTGCVLTKTYPNNKYDKNLRIRTKNSGIIFISKAEPYVHIYRFNADCEKEHQGAIKLNKPLVEIGIPSGALASLEFTFYGPDFVLDREVLLKPRKGYVYDIKNTYQKKVHDLVIMETHPRKSKKREIKYWESNYSCSDR